MMKRRHALLTLLAAPAGCAIRPLAPLAVQASASPTNAPRVRPAAVGQNWTYNKYNAFNSALVDTETATVAAVEQGIRVTRRDAQGQDLAAEQYREWGSIVADPVWDSVQHYDDPLPLWSDVAAEQAPQTVFSHYEADGGSYRFWIQARRWTAGWEQVRLGDQTYACLRIERYIRLEHPDVMRVATIRQDTLWLAPEVGRWVARETTGRYALQQRNAWSGVEDHFRWELQSWH